MSQRKNGQELIIFTAPSGAGKTTIVKHLLHVYDFLDFSVSATTRKKRTEEVHGKDYYFLSEKEFSDLIEKNELAEYVEVYNGSFYGTLDSEIERIWANGKRIIFDIDVKGATTLKRRYGDRCLAIFVSPPSLEVLIRRLERRNTETRKSLEIRIDRVKKEMMYRDSFDDIIINDELDTALAEAEKKTLKFLFPDSKLF